MKSFILGCALLAVFAAASALPNELGATSPAPVPGHTSQPETPIPSSPAPVPGHTSQPETPIPSSPAPVPGTTSEPATPHPSTASPDATMHPVGPTPAPEKDDGPKGMAKLFIDVKTLPDNGFGILQLIFLAAVYAYILTQGGTLIKDGSELLLLIPAWAGLVGSVVLPVLGAVPDGAIVLFSGLGSDAQKQLEIGIGALAGSTIMLLTVPWIVAIFAGRVNLDQYGVGTYIKPRGAPADWSKLSPPNAFLGTGVNVAPSVIYAAKIMLFTCLPFFVIQIPAMVAKCTLKNDESDCDTPLWAALVAGIMCCLLFLFYLIDQKRLSDKNIVTEARVEIQRDKAVKNHLMSLRALFSGPQGGGSSGATGASTGSHDGSELMPALPKEEKELRTFLRPFFRKYDTDNSGKLDASELKHLLRDLGEAPTTDNINGLMAQMDEDGSGQIDFPEFVASIKKALANVDEGSKSLVDLSKSPSGAKEAKRAEEGALEAADEQDGEEEEEEDEMPEEWLELSPDEQRKRILRRSFGLMIFGTIVVLLFSDPMVDVLSELGARSHIKPFYVAFILAPLVSNGSEFIAAFAYALKKTEKTITVSIATLLGAACMNNTFCLAIFLFIVAGKKLRWVFTAEVMSIVVVEIAMFLLCMICRTTHKTWTIILVASLFPISLGIVAGLEAGGFD